MKANRNKVILRFKKEDLEATQKSRSGLVLATHFDPAKHACTKAYIEADNEELNELGFHNGDCVLVNYIVGYDEQHYDHDRPSRRNINFLYLDGEDEIRWCDYVVHLDEKQQEVGGEFFRHVLGKKTENGFMPSMGLVFCEVPKMTDEKIGILWIPDTAKKVETASKGFKTTVKYIHPQDAKEMGLSVGDEVWCDRNSDAKRDVFGEELIRVPTGRVLGKRRSKLKV